MAVSWSMRLFVGLVALGWAVQDSARLIAAPAAFEWNVFLDGWQVLGPIPKLDRNAGELDRELVADEASLKPGEPITIGVKEYVWQTYAGRMVDFLYALGVEGAAGQFAIAYAYTEFNSDEEQDAILGIGHDDGVVVWLNGEEIYRHDALVASKLDQAAIQVKLKQGRNALLAKISQSIGAWEFGARLRPARLEKPLITLASDAPSGGDATRLPTLDLELLDEHGVVIETLQASGGRVETPRSIRYTVFAEEPEQTPAKVRIRYEAPGLVAFDETHAWRDVRAGKVLLPLKLSTPLRGRVVDKKTGQPVAGAQILSGEVLLGESTDVDGRFEFTPDDPLVDFVNVAAAGYEPRQARFAWPPDNESTIELTPGGHVVRGRVLTSDGKPLAGAVFRAYGGSRRFNLQTDEDGRFEAIGIAGTQTSLHPTVSHPDYIAKDSFTLPLDADGVTEIEWRLEPGATVTGVVTSKEDKKPVAGVTITSGADRFVSNRANPETLTDAEGRYQLSGVKPGPAMLHVLSANHAPVQQKINASLEKPAAADFTIEAGQPVTGRVTDPDGKPIAQVWIVTDTWSGARIFRREDRTDSEGRFTLPHMPATPVETDILKQGFVSKRNNAFVAGQHYDIALSPVVEHTIHVRLADSDAPPADVKIQKGYQWQGRTDVSWTDVGSYSNDAKYDVAAGVVRLRMSEPANAKIFWRLRVAGYRDAVVEQPDAGAAAQKIEALLEKTPTILGKVVDAASGAPLAGVMVALLTKQDRMRLDHYVNYDPSFQALDRFTGVQATTGVDGSFELPKSANEAEETDLLLFRKDGRFHYIRDARSVLGGGIELPLPEAAKVEGHVIVAGEPVADAEVRLAWIVPGSNPDQWDLPFGFGGQVTTDAEGRFTFSVLGPGRYQICRVRTFKNPFGGGSTSSHLSGKELVVLPGETVMHEFNQPAGHKVSGKAVGTSGEPLANCLVSVTKASDPTGRVEAVLSDADGNFTIEHLQPGSYQLRADQYEMTADGCGLGTEGAHGTASLNVTGDTSVTIKLAPRTQPQVARPVGGEQPTLVGSVPPDFSGKLFDRDDESFSLGDHFGKVVAIDFWATWCGPCMAVMPEMKELHNKYKEGNDVVFVTVSLDQDADALRSVMQEQGIEFPVIFESREASQAIASAFGVSGIPSSFVIGRNGRFASERIHGSQLLAATEAAVAQPLDPAFAKAGKPARLTVTLSLDEPESGLPGATIALKASNSAGETVLEETIRTPGQATRFTWLYPPLDEAGNVEVTVEAEGISAQTKTVPSPQLIAEVTFEFESPCTISGRILADDGQSPVPGAKVTAYRPDLFRRTSTSDAEGTFTLSVLPGSYTVTFAGTEDFAPIAGQNAQTEVALARESTDVELTACRTVTVTGTVTDEDGAPVAGVQVRTTLNETVATTDDEGRFELRGVPSRGSVQLYALARPKFATVTLVDCDGKEPQSLVLGQQSGRPGALAAGMNAPALTLYSLEEGEPIDWQTDGERETLIVFCALWRPETAALLEQAKAWADEHRTRFVPVSVDWSIEQARREAKALASRSGSDYRIVFAGPGGLTIAKDWNIGPSARAVLLSSDGKIHRVPSPGKLP